MIPVSGRTVGASRNSAEIWRDNQGFFVCAFPGNFDFVNAEFGRPNGSYCGGVTTYGAVTVGLNITPSVPTNPLGIKQIIMRPEIRYDTSLNNTTPFATGTKGSQFTFGGDIIVPFTVRQAWFEMKCVDLARTRQGVVNSSNRFACSQGRRGSAS